MPDVKVGETRKTVPVGAGGNAETLTLPRAELRAASLKRMSLRSGRQSTVVIIKESKHFELGFWLLCLDGLLTYGMGTSAIVVGSAELIAQFGFSEQTAAMVTLSSYLVAALALPLLGFVLDRIGKRLLFMLLQVILMIFGHFYILVHPSCISQCSDISVAFLTYGLTASLYILTGWGSLPLIVRPEHLSTAYGLLSCFQNIGTTVLPLVLNMILDHTQSYLVVETTFLGLAFASFALKLTIGCWDLKRRNGILMKKDPATAFEKYLNSR